MFGATSKDENDRFFHVVLAVVDNEMDANLMWILLELGDALYGDDNYERIITFVLDRFKVLVSAIAKVLPSSSHTYYLRHLEANFMKGNVRLGKH